MSNPQVIHSKFSFSGRKRWKACPISLHMSVGVKDESSTAAEEGTRAHTVAEFYVRQAFKLEGALPGEAPDQAVPDGLDLKGQTAAEWNAQLRRHGKDYVAFLLSLFPSGEEVYVTVESKVSIPSIHPELFGTADCLIWLPRLRKLIVVDYKYGFMSVDVGTYEDTNEQLSAYLVAAAEGLMTHHLVVDTCAIAVFQPRRPLQLPGQSLELDAAWIQTEREKLKREVAAVLNPGEPNPGDHCRYCKAAAAGRCPTVHNALATAIAAHCGEKSLLDMPVDDLVKIFASRTAFKAFWEDVEERIEQIVKVGHPNLRVKESQGRRMWGDPKLATQTFLAIGRVDLLQPISLSEAMAQVPEAFLEGLVARSKPSRSIQVVDPVAPTEIAATFAKYVKKD